jgi:hypothetical protein
MRASPAMAVARALLDGVGDKPSLGGEPHAPNRLPVDSGGETSALGHQATRKAHSSMSEKGPEPDIKPRHVNVVEVPVHMLSRPHPA